MKTIVAVSLMLCCPALISMVQAAGRIPDASVDKYQITAEEQTACGNDAMALCASAYPDEDRLLACMKVNRPRLSVACRPIFDEGLRRRHLN